MCPHFIFFDFMSLSGKKHDLKFKKFWLKFLIGNRPFFASLDFFHKMQMEREINVKMEIEVEVEVEVKVEVWVEVKVEVDKEEKKEEQREVEVVVEVC